VDAEAVRSTAIMGKIFFIAASFRSVLKPLKRTHIYNIRKIPRNVNKMPPSPAALDVYFDIMETTATATAATTATAARYPYFNRSYGIEFALFIFVCPVLFAMWSFAAAFYYYSGVVSAQLVKAAVYYSAAFALALLFYGNVRAVRKGKAVVMDGERIIKGGGGGGAIAVNCADVARARRSNIPFARRRMLLETRSGGVFVLPLCVRGGHEMVDKVFNGFEMRGVSFDGAAELRRRFRFDALRCNAMQALRDKNAPGFMNAAAAAALFNGLVAAIYWSRPLAESILWGFAALLFQALAYFAAERLHTIKLFRSFRDGSDGGNGNGGVGSADDAVDLDSLVNPTIAAVAVAVADDSFSRRYAVSALAALFAVMVVGILFTVPDV
jgi:hypothetical protein